MKDNAPSLKDRISSSLLDSRGRFSMSKWKFHDDLLKEIQSKTGHPDIKTAVYMAFFDDPMRTCKTCEKPLCAKSLLEGYTTQWCSPECMYKDGDYRESLLSGIKNRKRNTVKKDLTKKTKRKRQANKPQSFVSLDDSVSCSENIHKKMNATMKKRYGEPWYSRTPEYREKVMEFSRSKYGVDWPINAKEIRERSMQTCIERYGVPSYSMCDEWKNHMSLNRLSITEKIRKTCISRYGVDWFSKSDEFKSARLLKQPDITLKTKKTIDSIGRDVFYQATKSKRQETMVKRYSADNPMKIESFRLKAERTRFAKYGVKNYAQTIEFKERLKLSSIRKYGVDHFSKSHEVKSKIEKTVFSKYGVNYYFQSDDYAKKMRDQGLFKITKPQKRIENLLESLGVVFLSNDRCAIKPLEIDIFIPSVMIGIEVNGVYFHSSRNKEEEVFSRNRHLNKTLAAAQNGVRIFHVTDYEINSKWHIVESMIKSIVGKIDRKIHARSCKIEQIRPDEARLFLENNHIQGFANSGLYVALRHGSELVSVMAFSKARFNKNATWEITRFASKAGLHVNGGFSKLLTWFEKRHTGTIVTYADYSRSNGRVYEKNGFVRDGLSKPSYRWAKNGRLYNRHSFMRRNLESMLGDRFDPNLSESENCWRSGYMKVWDCGQLRFVKHR